MRLLNKDNKVCVSVESLMPDMSEYSFVVFRGELERVENMGERELAIRKLSEVGSQRLSENFLAAHGFSAEEGWEVSGLWVAISTGKSFSRSSSPLPVNT